ncbi:BTAD domain-containing putative transcriptional regulator [Planotetraspora kaengkrachanensis]|uniref:SARP family transcriptional regulator n=1 Tax=Planotetraspora kaengkrachanensis TaxID=575193 RepID=A0A8J3PPH5_9ACTN|nr:BTAD domain-containing putative transcriptional regulator [Planotetraspora kaengkrachanensis]GIG77671.1 SARP family transcriptional regulator [Planotetraspora kaengkrachanensis]
MSALPWLPGKAVAAVRVEFGVLGPVTAWDEAGGVIDVKGPRHRAVLARLIVARRRVVPVSRLVADLWEDDPPEGAVGAVRTFVAALRRALEPDRPPRSAPRLLVTEGPGYVLHAGPDAVDAWRFERAVAAAATQPADGAIERLEEALGWWRGPAYADFADQAWAVAERSRLAELRLHAVERQAEARLAMGPAAEAVPDLDAHVAEHPWREDAWRLLALALYRAGRQGDALAVLRRARTLLVEHLGVDPGPRLRGLEADILHHAPHLDPAPDAAGSVWAQAAAAYDRSVPSGARARLESTVSLMRDLALTGGAGLSAARRHRVAAVAAAEELGDAELTARVIGSYDVPAIWTRSDDPAQAAQVVAAAERALAALPPTAPDATRARLLATIALESRSGVPEPHGPATRGDEAARQAEEIARRLDDPALLVFVLNGVFMQSFHRTGLAGRRDEIGAEVVALSARHGLSTYEILGHLVRLQARCALGDFAGADRHAAAVERLAQRHERPLVGVFTGWYRALRLDTTGKATADEAETAYREAAARLDGAGMPGLERGLLPLALLCMRARRGLPLCPDGRRRPHRAPPETDGTDWGPYEPWVRPFLLAAGGHHREAAAALREVPAPPRDLLTEAMWCLVARAAVIVGDREAILRARDALAPAAGELAGAGSGLLSLGPVADHLAALRECR